MKTLEQLMNEATASNCSSLAKYLIDVCEDYCNDLSLYDVMIITTNSDENELRVVLKYTYINLYLKLENENFEKFEKIKAHLYDYYETDFYNLFFEEKSKNLLAYIFHDEIKKLIYLNTVANLFLIEDFKELSEKIKYLKIDHVYRPTCISDFKYCIKFTFKHSKKIYKVFFENDSLYNMLMNYLHERDYSYFKHLFLFYFFEKVQEIYNENFLTN